MDTKRKDKLLVTSVAANPKIPDNKETVFITDDINHLNEIAEGSCDSSVKEDSVSQISE